MTENHRTAPGSQAFGLGRSHAVHLPGPFPADGLSWDFATLVTRSNSPNRSLLLSLLLSATGSVSLGREPDWGNVGVQTPVQDPASSSSGCLPGSGLAGFHHHPHFTVLRSCHTVLTAAAPFHIPTHSDKGSCSSASSLTLIFLPHLH